MKVIYRPPNSSEEFEDYFKFRWEWLRKPLGLKFGSERDELESTAFHIAAFSNENIIGVSRLQIEKNSTARIRYMAVDSQRRSQGIGSNMLEKLETIAKKEKIKTCWLLARDTATAFYLKNNYQITSKAESELKIKHLRMEKQLHD